MLLANFDRTAWPWLQIAFLHGRLQNLGREKILGGRKRHRGAVSCVSKADEGVFDCLNGESPPTEADRRLRRLRRPSE